MLVEMGEMERKERVQSDQGKDREMSELSKENEELKKTLSDNYALVE